MKAILNRHWRAQVALEHLDSNKFSRILSLIERFLQQVRVTVTGQAEEQVVCLLPRLDVHPFENNIIDHDNLHLTDT